MQFGRLIVIRIVSAELDRVLTNLTKANVELMDVKLTDFLTAQVKLRAQQFQMAKRVLGENGASLHVIKKEGILWRLYGLQRRPVLVIGLLMFAVLACTLPGRVFFIQVTGNEAIPEAKILSIAQDCGITFGTKASVVRSEIVKNKLLAMDPGLQWVGITTKGSVATIQVKERTVSEEIELPVEGVSSVVASQDGVISEMTVYRGNPLYQVGQSVKAGDVLVSGYTDCGIKVRGEMAKADVFAYTLHDLTVISPAATAQKGEILKTHTCYQLCIGKKVINLCNHSGIQAPTCGKMYSEYYWPAPGAFRLPVSLRKIECYFYEQEECGQEEPAWLAERARNYLQHQMIAGKILEEKLEYRTSETQIVLTGQFACHEIIGQVKYEEIGKQNAKDN